MADVLKKGYRMPKPKHVDQHLYVFVGILYSFELPLVLMGKTFSKHTMIDAHKGLWLRETP